MPVDPEHIAISKSRGIAIDWKDGLHADYPLALLRDECPCATCTGAHGTPPERTNYQKASTPSNPFQLFKPALRINSVEPIGNYAIRIYWNDNHSTGIYTWEFLHELAGKLSKG
ncbi:MAG: DUF971 domain-containing protein [Acidobacteria bacterium]|nr:DUF971 domain-containing protein [Acidobacteriota bacterium]